jgi:hypothetical protein
MRILPGSAQEQLHIVNACHQIAFNLSILARDQLTYADVQWRSRECLHSLSLSEVTIAFGLPHDILRFGIVLFLFRFSFFFGFPVLLVLR